MNFPIIKDEIIIAIPAYNEEEFISEAIESVLRQTHTKFKLLICDNASTDDTSALCRYFAKKDSRIHYVRHDQNYGSCQNFQFTFEATNSKYLIWLGAHDFIAADFLEKHYAYMEAHENCSISYSNTHWLNEQGHTTRITNGGETYLIDSQLTAAEKYIQTLEVLNECTLINQFIRRSALPNLTTVRQVGPLDLVFLCHIIAHGYANRIPEQLYFRRDFTTRKQTTEERLSGKKSPKYSFSDLYVEFIHSIYEHSDILPDERDALILKVIHLMEKKFAAISGRQFTPSELLNNTNFIHSDD